MQEIFNTINPYVFMGCALLGYIVKNWTNNALINNKVIPTLVLLIGAVSYFFIYGGIDNAVVGAFVGLSSTGGYEMVKNILSMINGGKE